MTVVTKQELEDAAADAATLEAVVNGDDTTTVTSRLGRSIMSVAKAIKDGITTAGAAAITAFNSASSEAISSFNSAGAAAITTFNSNGANAQSALNAAVTSTASNASTASTAAEIAAAARDAAVVNAAMYTSIAAGLAAVADGVQFQVVSSDGTQTVRYRRDSASTYTVMGTFPTVLGVNGRVAPAEAALTTGYSVAGARPTYLGSVLALSTGLRGWAAGQVMGDIIPNGKRLERLKVYMAVASTAVTVRLQLYFRPSGADFTAVPGQSSDYLIDTIVKTPADLGLTPGSDTAVLVTFDLTMPFYPASGGLVLPAFEALDGSGITVGMGIGTVGPPSSDGYKRGFYRSAGPGVWTTTDSNFSGIWWEWSYRAFLDVSTIPPISVRALKGETGAVATGKLAAALSTSLSQIGTSPGSYTSTTAYQTSLNFAGYAVGFDAGDAVAVGELLVAFNFKLQVPSTAASVVLQVYRRALTSTSLNSAPGASGDELLQTITNTPAQLGLTPGAASAADTSFILPIPFVVESGFCYLFAVEAADSVGARTALGIGIAGVSTSIAVRLKMFYRANTSAALVAAPDATQSVIWVAKKYAFSYTSNERSNLPTRLAPKKVYTVRNDLVAASTAMRSTAIPLYIDHLFSTFSAEPDIYWAESNSDVVELFSPVDNDGNASVSHGNTETYNKTFTIASKATYNSATVTVEQKSTKESVGKSTKPIVMCIGDSVTEGYLANSNVPSTGPAQYWSWMRQEFERARIDDGDNASYHNALFVGRVLKSFSLTYGAVSGRSLRACAEGKGGWKLTTHLNWARHWSVVGQGLWDLLGLGDGSGTDYTGSTAQQQSIHLTPEGYHAPINTAAFLTYINSELSTSYADYAAAVAGLQSIEAAPENPFYDKTVAIGGDHAFSLAAYLGRYKTLASDGTTRLVVGSTAGSQVTSATAFDVCVTPPTHIIIQHSLNDGNVAWIGTAFSRLVAAIKAEYTANSWGAVNVAVSIVDAVGTYFPSRYPDFDPMIAMWNAGLHVAQAANLQRVFDAFWTNSADEDTAKTWILPSYHVMLTAWGASWRSVDRPDFAVTGERMARYKRFWGAGPTYHQNGLGHAVLGLEMYAWLKYTLSL